MRFNYDLLPGEQLSFDEISERYSRRYPDDKSLTSRGLLSPSTSSKNWTIRAVFASKDSQIPLEDLLFIESDNERKNYLQRFEHYLVRQESFLYFRRSTDSELCNTWKVMGESRVLAMLGPASIMTQSLLLQRGYTLTLLRSEDEEEYWQLYDPLSKPCFKYPRKLQFIVVLTSPMLPPPAGVIAGTLVGRQVKANVWQRASQAEFAASVKARYGACVITGTRLMEHSQYPWVEACHIDTQENDDGFLQDNSVDNGLFLRSDLQRLFTSRLLTIHPTTGTVNFRHGLQEESQISAFYQEIDGKICALWQQVPAATREKLHPLR